MKPIRNGRIAARYVLTSGTAVAALATAPAFGQDAEGDVRYAEPAEYAEPAPDAREPTADSNTIIVTATKRAKTLQDTPVAVTVTTEEELERAEIRDLKDLTSIAPSLKVTQLQSSANTNFIIRGFGNGANNAGIEPSVGVFVDGVYRSRSAARINDLPDLQRIEVLRGPQSTLFGKNASAGVISVVTAEPRFNFGGQAEVSYGNFNAMVAKANVYGPLSETIAASIGGGINKRDGYIDDLGTGGDTNERNRWFTRGQLLFEPNGLIKVRLIGDYEKTDEDCCANVLLQEGQLGAIITAPAPFGLGAGNSDPADPYADVIYSNFPSSNDIENWGVSGQVDFGFGPFNLTSITAYRGVDAVTNQDSDFTSADLINRNFQDLSIRTFTQELRATATFGDFDLLLGAFYFDESIDQKNELFYGNDLRAFANAGIFALSDGAFTVDGLEDFFGQLASQQAGQPVSFDEQFFIANRGLDEAYSLDNKAISLFGQLDWSPTDRLTITAGMNYTKDKKTFATDVTSTDVFSSLDLDAFQAGATQAGISQTIGSILMVPSGFATPEQIMAFAGSNPEQFQAIAAGAAAAAAPIGDLAALQYLPPFVNVPNAVESGKLSDSDISVTLRAAYDITDSLNGYITYATGYKAPSVNLSRDSRPTPADLAALGDAVPAVVGSGSRFAGAEDSELWEIGLKGDFGPVNFTFAAFKQAITGFQSNIFTGTGFFLANAGKQEVIGFEFDGSVRPVDPLLLRMAVTYLDSEYKDFPLSGVGDLSGTAVAGVPPISATWSAQYTHEFGNGDALIARGDYHYESQVAIVEGLPGFIDFGQDAAIAASTQFKREVDEVNASLTYAMNNGLQVSVWGRNLLNDRYLLSIFDTPIQPLSISGYPNQPRTYGVTARYKF
ncbi:TonB-dependent receptor [Croceicoccus naphthovorans]|uniref:TonB-dependent receptor n=1 Tax=Croceicoccus naphthovorans TaxID=1348774 RepID=A0A0G3XFU1_9SPHN|nr:TonB-dependent receptor [Croceicoccus naphthovorans]AKM09516.1 TonB-dependent receptor [Croceicoccus naphthovorans]MBB3989742.1 outer membrane receptor protein involved in Fe transport [Croceicoccus naphthovorans]